LKNKDGFLYKMVEQTGTETSEFLHNLAVEVQPEAHSTLIVRCV